MSKYSKIYSHVSLRLSPVCHVPSLLLIRLLLVVLLVSCDFGFFFFYLAICLIQWQPQLLTEDHDLIFGLWLCLVFLYLSLSKDLFTPYPATETWFGVHFLICSAASTADMVIVVHHMAPFFTQWFSSLNILPLGQIIPSVYLLVLFHVTSVTCPPCCCLQRPA